MNDDKVIPPEVWNNFWRRQAVLMRRPRVRRTAELPDDGRGGEDGHGGGERERAYPHRLAGVLPGYDVAYRRGGWRRLYTVQDYPNEPAHVRVRDTFAWISQDGRRVGAVRLQEIDGHHVSPEAFLLAMDDESDRLSRLAQVLRSEWEDIDLTIFLYGPVLELAEVWVEPRHPRAGIWKPVAHALVDRLLRKRKCALMICHCFPIEYSCLVPDHAQTKPAFERRRRAMMRVAAREFGLAPLPGAPGRQGYMWRPRPGLEEHFPEPEFDESWGDFDY